METTSSPTSNELSAAPDRRRLALAAWLVLAAIQVGLATAGALLAEEETASEPLYRYETAIGPFAEELFFR
ncbi:MAG TPA: hypothetical protein VE270_06685, partial [Thermoleophilaceae bacterium]|nr:hypothetical protein [Thermoleophilaceae bacterium]